MMGSLRSAIIALTLLVLGGGHAACACAAVASALAGPDITVSAPSAHSHHTAANDPSKDPHCNKGSEVPDHNCTHCVTAALPADASLKAVSAFPADVAVLPPVQELKSSSLFRLADLNIEPDTGPPRPRSSPVTLKVRLQI
jgi:hypothetical protein